MMKLGHVAGTMPPALLCAVYAPELESLGPVGSPFDLAARMTFFVLAVATSTIPDWDHSRFRDRWHPGAAFARITARAMYRVHTKRDLDRWEERARRFADHDPDDLHRGPTHCVEWGLTIALVLGGLAAEFPPLAPFAWHVAAGIALGTVGHVAIDSLTPAGVPASMIYNYLRHGEVWRMHAFAFRWHNIGRASDGGPITFRSPGIITVELRLPLGLRRDFAWIGMVTRTLSYPTITVIPVDESSEGCRPGLFYTNSCAEKMGFIPVAIGSTVILGLVLTDTFVPVMYVLTGWSIFGPA